MICQGGRKIYCMSDDSFSRFLLHFKLFFFFSFFFRNICVTFKDCIVFFLKAFFFFLNLYTIILLLSYHHHQQQQQLHNWTVPSIFKQSPLSKHVGADSRFSERKWNEAVSEANQLLFYAEVSTANIIIIIIIISSC